MTRKFRAVIEVEDDNYGSMNVARTQVGIAQTGAVILSWDDVTPARVMPNPVTLWPIESVPGTPQSWRDYPWRPLGYRGPGAGTEFLCVGNDFRLEEYSKAPTLIVDGDGMERWSVEGFLRWPDPVDNLVDLPSGVDWRMTARRIAR